MYKYWNIYNMAMNYEASKEMAKERKSISISETTHSKLVKLGKYGESMDDIITRLIEGYREK